MRYPGGKLVQLVEKDFEPANPLSFSPSAMRTTLPLARASDWHPITWLLTALQPLELQAMVAKRLLRVRAEDTSLASPAAANRLLVCAYAQVYVN
jgi:hypothetical protein